jgi:hypothetical protein
VVTLAPPRTAAHERAGAIALALVAAALLATLASPLWVLLVAPLVLGVPHLAADLRYLILRGPLRPVTIVMIATPLAAIIGLRAAALLGAPLDPQLEIALGLMAVGLGASAGRRGRPRTVTLVAVGVLAVPALLAPRGALLVLLHGHNAVAFVIWLRWADRGVHAPVRLAIVLGVVAVIALCALGAFDACLRAAPATHLDLARLAHSFAPGAGPIAGGRVVLIYAFMQAVHYVIWLQLVPGGLARPGGGPAGLAGLRRDFGTRGLGVIAIAAIAVPVLALAGDAARVRDTYLAVVVFHAWLELAVIGSLVAARARLA